MAAGAAYRHHDTQFANPLVITVFKEQRVHPLRYIVASCLLVTAPASLAETLEDAWAVVLASDHNLQAVRDETSAAESELSAAKSNRLPVFSVDSAFTTR